MVDPAKLSDGRVWVTTGLDLEAKEEEDWLYALDDINGAYRKVEIDSEIYIQPTRQISVCKQHRLRRTHKVSSVLMSVVQRTRMTGGLVLRNSDRGGGSITVLEGTIFM